MSYSVLHHINGQKISDSTLNSPIYNPALGKQIGEVVFANAKTCDLAVATATKAFQSWSKTTAISRARILFKFRELLEKNQEELATLVTQEHGKTKTDAKGSIARAIEVVELHCGILNQLQGDFSANVASQVDCYTIKEPLGVCVGVSPFNFPVMVPVWMMIPAIACGNTFILKPSEQDPSAPIRLIELLEEAGLPSGVVNCVHGNKEAVDTLITHPDVSACTAVASTPVAAAIYQKAIMHGKRAHTFGSAKNHALVMPDADFNQTAESIVSAAYGSAGERCMAISAVVTVGEDTASQLIEAMRPRIEAIRIGSGEKEDTDMGPLISVAHRQRVLQAIDKGVDEGAELLMDGRAFCHKQYPNGYFLGPSLFDQVQESMTIYQNEIFGPVLILIRAKSFEEALNLVNRNQYGNGTAIFTRDGFTAREYVQNVKVGMVGVNIPIPVPIASHPFGGWKQSSFGDTNMHGLESIHFYTRLKTITSKWPNTSQKVGFHMPSHD